MTNKEKLIKLFEDNPTEFGLERWPEGICEALMNGAVYDSVKPFISDYKTSYEIVGQSEEGEDYYDVYTVFKFVTKPHKVYTSWPPEDIPEDIFYVKFYGYHRSHDGTYYTGFKEVTPATKTVEVFE